MRWTEAEQRVRISRDDRFATLYPAQTLASVIAASVNLVVILTEINRFRVKPTSWNADATQFFGNGCRINSVAIQTAA